MSVSIPPWRDAAFEQSVRSFQALFAHESQHNEGSAASRSSSSSATSSSSSPCFGGERELLSAHHSRISARPFTRCQSPLFRAIFDNREVEEEQRRVEAERAEKVKVFAEQYRPNRASLSTASSSASSRAFSSASSTLASPSSSSRNLSLNTAADRLRLEEQEEEEEDEDNEERIFEEEVQRNVALIRSRSVSRAASLLRPASLSASSRSSASSAPAFSNVVLEVEEHDDEQLPRDRKVAQEGKEQLSNETMHTNQHLGSQQQGQQQTHDEFASDMQRHRRVLAVLRRELRDTDSCLHSMREESRKRRERRIVSTEDRQRYARLFRALDLDSSGCLSLEELREALQSLPLHFSTQETSSLLKRIDSNRNQRISWPEFLEAMINDEGQWESILKLRQARSKSDKDVERKASSSASDSPPPSRPATSAATSRSASRIASPSRPSSSLNRPSWSSSTSPARSVSRATSRSSIMGPTERPHSVQERKQQRPVSAQPTHSHSSSSSASRASPASSRPTTASSPASRARPATATSSLFQDSKQNTNEDHSLLPLMLWVPAWERKKRVDTLIEREAKAPVRVQPATAFVKSASHSTPSSASSSIPQSNSMSPSLTICAPDPSASSAPLASPSSSSSFAGSSFLSAPASSPVVAKRRESISVSEEPSAHSTATLNKEGEDWWQALDASDRWLSEEIAQNSSESGLEHRWKYTQEQVRARALGQEMSRRRGRSGRRNGGVDDDEEEEEEEEVDPFSFRALLGLTSLSAEQTLHKEAALKAEEAKRQQHEKSLLARVARQTAMPQRPAYSSAPSSTFPSSSSSSSSSSSLPPRSRTAFDGHQTRESVLRQVRNARIVETLNLMETQHEVDELLQESLQLLNTACSLQNAPVAQPKEEREEEEEEGADLHSSAC